MNHTYLKAAWESFSRGDPLSDDQLKALYTSAQDGLSYLQARGENLAGAKTAQDIIRIEGYIHARKLQLNPFA